MNEYWFADITYVKDIVKTLILKLFYFLFYFKTLFNIVYKNEFLAIRYIHQSSILKAFCKIIKSWNQYI